MKRLRLLLLVALPFAYLSLAVAATSDTTCDLWVMPRLCSAEGLRCVPEQVGACGLCKRGAGTMALPAANHAVTDSVELAEGSWRLAATASRHGERLTLSGGALDLSRSDGADCARRRLAASSTIRSNGGRIDRGEWDTWAAGANLLIEVPRRQNRIKVGGTRATLAPEPFAIARGGHLLTRLVTRDALALEPLAPVGWRDSASGKTYSVRRSGQGYFEPVPS
ncbi:MAG: hypothetical protein ACI4QD_08770 [Kiritimatiellia bacterium]